MPLKVRVVPPQHVELLRGRVLVGTLTGRFSEVCSDVVKGAAFGLRHFEVGEDEEAEQQDGEDDEDVRATESLRGHRFGVGQVRARENPTDCFIVCVSGCRTVSDVFTSTYWKHIPTAKLAVQLQKPATAMAAGRGPWLKSSATMNQGMGPGPTSKKATKLKTAPTLT